MSACMSGTRGSGVLSSTGDDINKGTASSKLISFANDTIVYPYIAQADDCDNLQLDLNSIYNWAVHNNMFF